MLEKRFFKVRSSLVNVLTCIGASFFLCSHSIAMEEAKGELVSLGPTRFQFEKLNVSEKQEFSSLVYTVGSTRGDVEEIKTYCDNRAAHYRKLAHGDANSLHMTTVGKWSKVYKTKVLADIVVLEIFYITLDTAEVEAKQLKLGTGKIRVKVEAKKSKADALFHHFYPFYDDGNAKCWNSLCRKISRRTIGGEFCRPKPDFTIPDAKTDKAFYDFYMALVPIDMRINSNQALTPASPTVTDGSCSEEDDDA
jgi:hypothetical protein